MKNNRTLRVGNGRLFSKYSEYNIASDFKLELSQDITTKIKTVNLSFNSEILQNLRLDLSNPYDSSKSIWIIISYSIVLFWIWWFFTNEVFVHTK